MKIHLYFFWMLAALSISAQVDYEKLIQSAEALRDENPEKSNQYVDQILDADSAQINLQTRIKALQLKGLSEMYSYQFDNSNQLFSRAYALSDYLGNQKDSEILKGSLLLDIGRNFNWQSNYDTALAVMIQSKNVFEGANDLNGIGQALNAIAIIYIQYSNDLEKALTSFTEALNIHTLENDTASAARVMQNVGQIHNMQGNNDSALYYLRISNRLVEELNDKRSLAIGSNILGAVFFDMNQLDSSEIYYKKAIELDIINQDSVGLLYDYSQLASTLVASKKMAEAEKYSLLAFSNTKDIYIKSESAEILARIYESLGNTKKSLDYFKSFKSYSDSIRNEDQQNTVSELQTKYETAEKEKKIEFANVELDKRERFQTFLLIVICIIVLFSSVAIFLLIQRFKLKRALLSQEIDTLRVQINGIFGGGFKNLEIGLEEINKGLHNPLTEREYEVLSHAISDKNNTEIAQKVFISVNTVKTHLKNIYTKLGVSNRKEALEVLLKHN
ncbi:MAG: LuxR family transcriptional regulator [Cyclobacteriaceae bacterium]